ncbi:P-loop containing nucleoside triphosphate hydrolase protein [Lentinula detonsa]|uniref:P-loop containing nucleoside triphosphate hydrolase protein n=1 Tax=Lentinula detonsa TaxID=2804962 RepID=A0A9W8NZQ1_9AGAR|nr:P-loop containing nucleoside triphosphate hydrolase protein [Lentinula detonsa]
MKSSLPYHHVTHTLFNISTKRHSSSTTLDIFRNVRSAEQVHSFNAAQLKAADDQTQGDVFPWLKGLPEVIITGRANSGKSSLFNAVLGRKDLIKTSSKAGKTRRLDFFRVGDAPGKLILVDSPGYGDRGRPEWGLLFDSYVQKRKELRRVYITFNARHPINVRDQQMLAHLSRTLFEALSTSWASSLESGNPRLPRITQIQPVITKADHLPASTTEAQLVVDRLKKEVHNAVRDALEGSETGRIGVSSVELAKLMCLSPLVTTLKMNPPFGIENVRKNIVEACSLTG